LRPHGGQPRARRQCVDAQSISVGERLAGKIEGVRAMLATTPGVDGVTITSTFSLANSAAISL
jgi:hypothetical protein